MRGADGSADSAPITVDGALTAYKTDLISRNANPYNADWPRVHLTSALLSKPVALLAATELKKWRDGLLARWPRRPSTGLFACLSAALEQAAQHDKRITEPRGVGNRTGRSAECASRTQHRVERRHGARVRCQRLRHRCQVWFTRRYIVGDGYSSEPSRAFVR